MTIVSELSARSTQETPPLPIAPAFRKLPPPVLVVGMHRSGTSLVAGMLATLGVYMDPLFAPAFEQPLAAPGTVARRNGYAEAVAFRLLNESLLGRAGANWKQVTPFLQHRDRPSFASVSLLKMQAATYTTLQRNYLQPRDNAPISAWGWKDPRTSLLLPYWLRLFPQARILHVRRNPEAVIDSLQRREEAQRAQALPAPSLGARLLRLAANPKQIVSTLGRRLGSRPAVSAPASPGQNREAWLQLCEQYVGECLRYRDHPGGYLEMTYEEIVQDPIRTASRMADFACEETSLSQVLQAAAFVCVDSKGAGSRK